jgi:MFS family permease
VNTAFLVTAAAFLLPFGKLGDMIGRRRVFVAGLVSYTAFSVLAALAPSGAALGAAVALLGAAAAMIFGTGVAILTSVYPPADRGRVLGVNVSFTYAGLSLGPLLGGFLTNVFGWRAVYLLDAPVGIAAIVVALALLKGEWKGEEGQRFDLAGSLLSVAMLALLVVSLYVGRAAITSSSYPFFLKSMHVGFAVFSALCVAGVFASLARGRRAAPAA